MDLTCGDPNRYPPCPGCPRCQEAQVASAGQEPTDFGFPEYDPDPAETEPSEAETEPSEAETDPYEDESEPSEADPEPMEVSIDEEAMDIVESEGESDGDAGGDDDDDLPHTDDEGSETTVEGPLTAPTRVVIRSRDEPLPPPSHQVYRHPGGIRWMHTPRKRVPTIQGHDVFRAPLPTPEVPAPPSVRPEWVTHLRNWSAEQGLPPPMGQGQTTFEQGESSTANRALPVVVGRITRMGDSLATYQNLTLGHSEVALLAASRAQQVTDDQRHTDQVVGQQIDELEEAQMEILRLRNEQAGARDRIAHLETFVRSMWDQVHASQQELRELRERLNHQLGPDFHF